MSERDQASAAPAEGEGRQDGRNAKGMFTKGNTIGRDSLFPPGNLAALQHGLRAANLPPELAHLAGDVGEFVEAALIDEGGAAEIGARRKSVVRVSLTEFAGFGGLGLRGRGWAEVAGLRESSSAVRTADPDVHGDPYWVGYRGPNERDD